MIDHLQSSGTCGNIANRDGAIVNPHQYDGRASPSQLWLRFYCESNNKKWLPGAVWNSPCPGSRGAVWLLRGAETWTVNSLGPSRKERARLPAGRVVFKIAQSQLRSYRVRRRCNCAGLGPGAGLQEGEWVEGLRFKPRARAAMPVTERRCMEPRRVVAVSRFETNKAKVETNKAKRVNGLDDHDV
ncbi:unnamed protein product [Lampetra fluviatilis]